MKKKILFSILILIGIGKGVCIAQDTPKEELYAKNYALALQTSVKEAMNLSTEQCLAIQIQKHELDSLLKEKPDYDYWKHERTHLLEILDEKQYDIFLGFKNIWYAYADARKAWKNIRERDLANGLDSIQVIKEIVDYKLERLKLFDRYAYDDRTKYDELARELYNNFCPNVLRMINEVIAVEQKEKTYQGNITH